MLKKKFKRHATVKSITAIVLLLVVFSAIVLSIGYNTLTNALLEQHSEGAYLTAKTAAQLVNADTTASAEQMLKNVRSAVDEFVSVAEQFDDLTMI